MKSVLEAAAFGVLACATVASAANITTTETQSEPSDTINKQPVPITNHCSAMKNANWDNIKHACSWPHISYGYQYYNPFYKYYDWNFKRECQCREDLVGSYGAWSLRWTQSTENYVTCFTRDGKRATAAANEFNSVANCPRLRQTGLAMAALSIRCRKRPKAQRRAVLRVFCCESP